MRYIRVPLEGSRVPPVVRVPQLGTTAVRLTQDCASASHAQSNFRCQASQYQVLDGKLFKVLIFKMRIIKTIKRFHFNRLGITLLLY